MPNAAIIASGIVFGESPRWHEGRLWFSDFQARAVKSASVDGVIRLEFEVDDQPSGLGWMPDGSMLVVSITKRCLLRRFVDGRIVVHADLAGIAGFHCNDMVVDPRGRAYVGNFGFDLDAEIASRGLLAVLADHATADIAIVQPDGEVSVAASALHFPNGSVVTPDGSTLIVAETLAGRLTAFDIAADGTLSNRRLWASTLPRFPDGIAHDAEGAIWIANPAAAECARVAQGGEILDIVKTSQPCFACALGDEDGRTLFMLTAPASSERRRLEAPEGLIESVRVSVAGAAWP